jgi:hypothetical protein
MWRSRQADRQGGQRRRSCCSARRITRGGRGRVAHISRQRKCRRWPRFAERSGANLGPFSDHARDRRATREVFRRHSDFSCPPSTGTRAPRRNLRLPRSRGSCSGGDPGARADLALLGSGESSAASRSASAYSTHNAVWPAPRSGPKKSPRYAPLHSAHLGHRPCPQVSTRYFPIGSEGRQHVRAVASLPAGGPA